jgi:hypothetical protein
MAERRKSSAAMEVHVAKLECEECGAHTLVARDAALPAQCWACGKTPPKRVGALHGEPGKPIRTTMDLPDD